MLTRTTRSLLGGNHRAINKEQQNLDYGGVTDRLGGWKNKCSRTRRIHDHRRNLDAAISGIHDKQNTTRRHGRSQKDNTTILQDSKAAINFIKFIVFHFGVPHNIITDNGTNFTSKEFKNYCEGLGIKLKFASVVHPKTNGQVKKANGLICNGIKKRLLAPLEKAKHAWVYELPSVLWSL
jgi:hypothetical protein